MNHYRRLTKGSGGTVRRSLAVIIVLATFLLYFFTLPAGASSGRQEIVFIENNLADYQMLVDGVKSGMEVHVLDASQDGLAQIAQILAGRNGIDAIHIVSHGSEASVGLGSFILNMQNLQDQASELAAIGGAMNQDGDILLYGCDIAKGSAGEEFVSAVAQATQADVAASNDLTGSSPLQGNWNLEFAIGIINSSSLEFLNYGYLLLPNSTQTFSGYTISSNTGTSPDGYFTLTVSAGNLFADSYGAFINEASGNSITSYLEVHVSGTSLGSFQLGSATIGEYYDASYSITTNNFTNVYLVGYSDGSIVAQTSPYNSPDQGASYETNYTIDYSPFNGKVIDSFRVYYTAQAGTKQTAFNLVDFTISNASTSPPPSNTSPTFVGSTSTLSVNQNASATDIKSLLHVSDSDSSQTLTWSQSSAPSHGTLSFSSATASSGSTDITPSGTITYTPTVGYAGSDSFTVQVSDGTATATRTITVTVSDITAPTLSDAGSSSVTQTTATVSATSNEAASMYYVITTSSIAPTNTQVMGGQDHTGSAATKSGNGAATATVAKDFSVAGLTAGTQYYVYFVAKDSSNNASSVGNTNFTTTANTYTVTYNGNGNTGGSVPTDSGTYAQNASVTVIGNTGGLVKTGYTFAVWNTAANGLGTSYASGATFSMGTANVTLYAQWTINSYSVTYDDNGSTGGTSPTSVSQDYNTSVTVSDNGTLTKTGYMFTGWDTAADGSGTNYAAADTFTLGAANVTLYAQWTINSYTVTYDGNGSTGGSAPSSVSQNYNTSIVVLGNTGSLLKTGYTFAGWNTAADGTGTNYAVSATFNITGDVTLYAKWRAKPPVLPVTEPETTDTGVEVLVNGKSENAGTATTTKVNDQSVTTIKVDQKKLEEKLESEGQRAVITIPIKTNSEVVIGELNGQMIKNMENKLAVVEIKTDNATYTLPALQININAISDQIGKSVELQDIKVTIEISKPTMDTMSIVESSAVKGEFTIVAPSLNFAVKGTYGDKTVEVSRFNAYVERTIAIPDGVDPNKITTGVVVDPDGTVRHVPTKIVSIDGKYYAKMNSLTNSTYSVVWHPLTFNDVEQHWAKDAVNDMGSRMVISGIGNDLFAPDQDITRAEFAAIIVRGLGLKLELGTIPFSDVNASDWYSSAINTAYSYHLISGFEDGTFRPMDKITREQAMTIIAKAMKITDLKAKLSFKEAGELLSPFVDANSASEWAKNSIADCLQAGIVSGRNVNQLAPKNNISRAEVAAIVQRLLQKSNLI